jgi:hypothetical protein
MLDIKSKDEKIIQLPSTVTVKKFAELLGLPVPQIMTELMKNKILATINEEIDFDTASISLKTSDMKGKRRKFPRSAPLENLSNWQKEKEWKKCAASADRHYPGPRRSWKTTLLTYEKPPLPPEKPEGATYPAYQVKKEKLITFVMCPI